MHMWGLTACFFWATFPPEYLRTLREENIEELQKHPLVTLYHSEPRHLLISSERDEFINEFMCVVRCITSGFGNIGFLRRNPKSPIHHQGEA
jgi:hypothetical protein